MKDIEKAKKQFLNEKLTFVLVNADKKLVSAERGIKPMYLGVTTNKGLSQGASVADKVIGKAAALLAVYGGITSVYTCLTTFSAIEVCKKHCIAIEYEKVVVSIKNRDKSDVCPMEKLSSGVTEPVEMLKRVSDFINKP